VVIPPKKSNQTNPKDMIVEKSSESKDANKPLKNSNEAPTPAPTPVPTPAPTPAPKPTRALNDPRYKSE